MFERLEQVASRYQELEDLLGRPEVASNPARLREITTEMAGMRETVQAYQAWRGLKREISENEAFLSDDDPEVRGLARDEIQEQRGRIEQTEAELRRLLIPRDPNDGKNVVLEIRSGTGGDEAALFAGDLFRMYTRLAEARKWRVEILSSAETDGGGLREVIASIAGKSVYADLKYESGVHRVQRVPVTESQGRIHTSTVTVAVLPEAEEVDVQIDEVRDLRIDTFRSSGPGGQHVNTTDSAIRITHLPTGLAVSCQDEKSQHKNKARALRILRSRLLEQEIQRQREERAADRRDLIGTGERSERIRTYNFPQNRVTDHRVGLTLHRLEGVMTGDLDELLEAVRDYFQAQAMSHSGASE